MPIEIIKQRWFEEIVDYQLIYNRLGDTGGYSFDCKEDGTVLVDRLSECALQTYRKLVMGMTVDGQQYEQPFIRNYSRDIRHPSVGRCHCGELVSLGNFTNTCSCGRDYNMSGSLLAPREQWGEETGEHWSECY